MKIYQVRADQTKFQSMFYDRDGDPDLEELAFCGTHRADQWVVPRMYVLEPKLEKGNVFGLGGGAGTFIVDAKAHEGLLDLLEMSSELLPVSLVGELFYIVNVVEVVNVLDEHNTQWAYETGDWPIRKHAFYESRLTRSPLFKIPQGNSIDIFAIESQDDEGEGFKGRVEQLNLTGVTFEEVWRSEESRQ